MDILNKIGDRISQKEEPINRQPSLKRADTLKVEEYNESPAAKKQLNESVVEQQKVNIWPEDADNNLSYTKMEVVRM